LSSSIWCSSRWWRWFARYIKYNETNSELKIIKLRKTSSIYIQIRLRRANEYECIVLITWITITLSTRIIVAASRIVVIRRIRTIAKTLRWSV